MSKKRHQYQKIVPDLIYSIFLYQYYSGSVEQLLRTLQAFSFILCRTFCCFIVLGSFSRLAKTFQKVLLLFVFEVQFDLWVFVTKCLTECMQLWKMQSAHFINFPGWLYPFITWIFWHLVFKFPLFRCHEGEAFKTPWQNG